MGCQLSRSSFLAGVVDAKLGIHGGVLAEILGSLGPILGLDPHGVSGLVHVGDGCLADFQRVLAEVLDDDDSGFVSAFADLAHVEGKKYTAKEGDHERSALQRRDRT